MSQGGIQPGMLGEKHPAHITNQTLVRDCQLKVIELFLQYGRDLDFGIGLENDFYSYSPCMGFAKAPNPIGKLKNVLGQELRDASIRGELIHSSAEIKLHNKMFRADISLASTKTGKRRMLEIKSEGLHGNASERAYRYFAPGNIDTFRDICGILDYVIFIVDFPPEKFRQFKAEAEFKGIKSVYRQDEDWPTALTRGLI